MSIFTVFLSMVVAFYGHLQSKVAFAIIERKTIFILRKTRFVRRKSKRETERR